MWRIFFSSDLLKTCHSFSQATEAKLQALFFLCGPLISPVKAKWHSEQLLGPITRSSRYLFPLCLSVFQTAAAQSALVSANAAISLASLLHDWHTGELGEGRGGGIKSRHLAVTITVPSKCSREEDRKSRGKGLKRKGGAWGYIYIYLYR